MASSDPATVQRWATEHPECNWGVETGARSGVFVLDVDGEQGRVSLAVLEAQYGPLPATLTSITGRTDGGEQRFFRYSNSREIRSNAGKLGQGLDVRGAGGYVIVPPSIHETGRAYKWVDFTHPIADAPSWLPDLLSGDSRTNGVPPAPRIRFLVEGQRNDTLFRFGCAMRRRGATEDEIERRLLQKNKRECRPPLDTGEVRKIAASAASYEPGGPDPLETAWNAVLEEGPTRGFEQFLALARCLQNARPGLPIALPLQRISGLMECDWTQVRRWRKMAVRDGWIHLKESYIPHVKAALYTFHEFSTPTVPLSHDVPLADTTSGLAGQVDCAHSGTPIVRSGIHVAIT